MGRMIDVRALRDNPEPARASQRARGANPGLVDEDGAGDASEAGKNFVTVTSCTGALTSVRTALWSCSAARIRSSTRR